MDPRHLLRLYPRAWRERYGDELLATLEHGPLRLRTAIDVVRGALDAWVSADVRRVTIVPAAPHEGGRMSQRFETLCEHRTSAVTPRDGLIGAAVLLAGALVCKAAASATSGAFPAASHAITNLAFLGPFTLSMPFWLMKGQSWKAQTLIVGGTMAVLVFTSFNHF